VARRGAAAHRGRRARQSQRRIKDTRRGVQGCRGDMKGGNKRGALRARVKQ
jgi:hypothetical protein